MTIKVNLAPKTIKAELGDYGVFNVRPMGINEDLLLSQYARELQEAVAELDKIKEKVNDKLSDEESAEIGKKLEQTSAQIMRDKERVVEVFKRLIACDDEARHEKLFNEVPLGVLREKYEEIIQNG